MTLIEAYMIWASLFPGKERKPGEFRVIKNRYAPTKSITVFYPGSEDGQCCFHENHLHMRRTESFDHTGKMMIHEREEAKPDKDVCEREKAWREYCRIRDGIVHE